MSGTKSRDEETLTTQHVGPVPRPLLSRALRLSEFLQSVGPSRFRHCWGQTPYSRVKSKEDRRQTPYTIGIQLVLQTTDSALVPLDDRRDDESVFRHNHFGGWGSAAAFCVTVTRFIALDLSYYYSPSSFGASHVHTRHVTSSTPATLYVHPRPGTPRTRQTAVVPRAARSRPLLCRL